MAMRAGRDDRRQCGGEREAATARIEALPEIDGVECLIAMSHGQADHRGGGWKRFVQEPWQIEQAGDLGGKRQPFPR
jgi:hypothetical protein